MGGPGSGRKSESGITAHDLRNKLNQKSENKSNEKPFKSFMYKDSIAKLYQQRKNNRVK